MRLQAIKLAGFKSFVDSTNVPFPSNLCAVVGPNGCGKSNIIDAVRWVMGETSAKNLRGESMADVIFNGSTGRKPIGQASIELLFDNTEGRLTGEYAAYTEISIKRQVTRDGLSAYFLNGQKCRRKDITDIFLGTGLGPRSYSIIEQGMISNLIEAKPEELRVYLEEAAGISKYKDRRRETERRISHTRDNLDRLADLREELERQLHHLERQARAAERYTELRKEERQIRAQLHALRWQSLDAKVKLQDEQIGKLQIEQEARTADLRNIAAQTEEKRDALTDQNDAMNEVQRRFYDLGTEIARIEESIQYQQEREQQLTLDLEQLQTNGARINQDLENDRQQLQRLQGELKQVEPEQSQVNETAAAAVEQLTAAESAMQDWQTNWDEFNQQAAATRQQAEVEQTRIEQLEHTLDRLTGRIQVQREEADSLASSTVEAEIEPLQMMLDTQEQQVQRINEELESLAEKISSQRESNQHNANELDQVRSDLQGARGRFASLEALQQAALGQQDDAEVQWLSQKGLVENARLGELVKVESPWELAVETVLGEHLQAVCLDSLDPLAEMLTDFSKGSLAFLEQRGDSSAAEAGSLLEKVSAPVSLAGWLGNILVAESLADAMVMRNSLKPEQSVITPEGLWIGPNWLRVSKDRDASVGVISRQQEMDQLQEQIESLARREGELATELDGGINHLKQMETDREQQAGRMAEQQRAFSETRAQLGAKKVQAEQIKTDLSRIREEIVEGEQQQEQDQQRLRDSRQRLQEALDKMEADVGRRAQLTQQREELRQQLEQVRQYANEHRNSAHTLELRIQSLRSQADSMEQAITRLEAQQSDLNNRQQSLEQAKRDSAEPQNELQGQLKELLDKRVVVENELIEQRQQIETTEHAIRQLEEQRGQIEESIERVRSSLEKVRMDWQALDVRRNTIVEQLREDGDDLETVIRNLPEEANEDDWDAQLTRIGNRIQRLGAINLAAIDEFKVQQERKQYLDAQNEDLEKALRTLENAIRKIDVETRTRFKETFDRVNSRLQQLFPKVFGGGHAYLEMTGEDLLDTGVGLMARPPGKRNTSIHLLSGGEKAMTAIALVFSIFSLNPAPFCLLDEVDAPLDDTNTGRYAELLKEMSRTVQFIFITHNKITMEMADHLMGVTMHEPGVSRLVAVDVDEAVAMAAV